MVGADRRLRLVRGAPVELVLGLRGDTWIGMIVAGAASGRVTGRSVRNDGNARDWDLTLEAGSKRTGGRRDTGDEPDGMLGGTCMHDDLTYGLGKNVSGQKKTVPEDG